MSTSGLAPLQLEELHRLQALARLQLDAVAQDPVLDALVRVAAQSLHCPSACINMVGSESVWSLATHRAEPLLLPRADAFCSEAVAQRCLLEIPDLGSDERFARHPMVMHPPLLRFYAGAPVMVDGHCLGTLCVLDTANRSLSADERLVLQELAQAVGHWLSHRHAHLDLMRREAPERLQLENLIAVRTGQLLAHEARADGATRPHVDAVSALGLPTRKQDPAWPRSGFAARPRDQQHSVTVLIDDILDFAEWDEGALRLQPAPLVLRPWIERLVDAHLDMAWSLGVRLHTFVDPGLCDVILADPLRLGQVLDKLLAQAIEFCGEQARSGQVSLRCLAVGVDRMRLQIRHVGQTPAESPNPDGSPSAQGWLGTGLGLSIAQRLVKAMDGRIQLTPVVGHGAECTVELPLQAVSAAEPAPSRSRLKDITCTWRGPADDRWADWSVYLRDAGAQVVMTDSPGTQAPGGSDTGFCLTVDRVLANGDASAADVHFVRGRRRSPQRDARGGLWLDEDALHRNALLHAVVMAADRDERQTHRVSATNTNASAVRGHARARSVLVADADPVARAMLARQLALLGVPAMLADSGDQALRLWRDEPEGVGLVLTDLPLAGIDGLALCRAIRGAEAPGAHCPVIALLADGRHGDPERCLASGMDDCLSKPVSLDRLSQVLQHWQTVGAQALPRLRVPWSASTRSAPVQDMDPDALERAVGPDRSAQAEVCRVYLESLQRLLPELDAAVAQCDWIKAGEIAHRLKSSSKLLGASLLGHLLDKLEQAGRSQVPEEVRALLQALPPAVQGVQVALAELS